MNLEKISSLDYLLELLNSNYLEWSPVKKEDFQMKNFDVIRYHKEICALLPEMINPESSLFLKDATDKDLVEFASTYSRIHEETKSYMMPTGEVGRDGQEKYENTKASREEQDQLIKMTVEELNKKKPITIASILGELRKNKSPQLNYQAIQDASRILDNLEVKKDVETSSKSSHDIEEER